MYCAVRSVCSDVVADSMEKDKPVTTVPALQFIMKYIRVLLYSGGELFNRNGKSSLNMNSTGEFDLNCNTLGTLHTLENAMWAGRFGCEYHGTDAYFYIYVLYLPAVFRMWNTAKRSLWRFQKDIQVWPTQIFTRCCAAVGSGMLKSSIRIDRGSISNWRSCLF